MTRLNQFLKISAGMGAAVCMTAHPALSIGRAPFAAIVRQVTSDDAPEIAAAKKFLHARSEHDSLTMYSLWSIGSRKLVPYSAIQSGEVLKSMDASTQPMADKLRSLMYFILDSNGSRGYSFTLVGSDPKNPGAILVSGAPTGATQSMTFAIFTVKDTDGQTRFDLMKSAEAADPSMVANARATSSVSNVKQICLGVIQYMQDNNEHFPDADKWTDEIMPYVRVDAVFHDPNDLPDHKWSYAFNRSLSGKSDAAIADPANTVVIFDSTLGTKNAADIGQSIPHPGRDGGAGVYGFADGHVRKIPDAAAPKIGG